MDRLWRTTPTDGYPSSTSHLQIATEEVLKARYLSTALNTKDSTESQPTLNKNSHIQFLLRNLVQGFPARYVSQDASQPWLIFWTLQGFSVLGIGLDDQTKKRARDTLLALQHPSGGFAGGPGQAAHLLPTYAAVCAMAIVGQPGEGGGWEKIDRKGMYDFFMSLKQPDGSFLVAHDAEVDVRGIYCLLVAATLLNILTPELVAGTAEFISSCQTYEGGFGNASYPGWAFRDDGQIDLNATRPPLGEAHGGYTFCATASWVLLQPYINTYYTNTAKPSINFPALLRWLTQMQGSTIELGGFRGRTNKLVDGCYSWWVGGCVALVEALLGIGAAGGGGGSSHTAHVDDQDEEWLDADDSLFNRRALQEYILIAGQHPAGGLVDKPPKTADSYHTLYCLAGLSAAQHHVIPSDPRKTILLQCWADETDDKLENLKREAFANALSWIEEEGTSTYVGGEKNRLNATHPLFDLTVTHSEAIMAYFYERSIPSRFVKKPQAPKT